MTTFWEKLLPRDIIAMLLIIGGMLLLLNGIDGVIGSILLAIVAFYFGAEIMQKRQRIKEV